MHRSKLQPDPQNPRILSPASERALRRGLKAHGLVDTPVWNKRTGELVGGHQRIDQLDALEGGQDYELDVAVVDVSPTAQKELLVLLNNPGAQGEWDMEALHGLLATPDLVLEHTGFELSDLPVLFESHPLIPVIDHPGTDAAAEAVAEVAPKGAQGVPGSKGRTAEDYRADIAAGNERQDSEAMDCGYLVVLCASSEQRAELCAALGYGPEVHNVDASIILEALREAGPGTRA